ncbi:unnamed protein product [Leptidea sinapis]|uniref:Uncharacterized protein n=1 Tax=Leptidea sinapis TaxID=189913 RepID=A0A5E4QB74_9NEOP|nr:unnamed protein product [Leptidea sinapis]
MHKELSNTFLFIIFLISDNNSV